MTPFTKSILHGPINNMQIFKQCVGTKVVQLSVINALQQNRMQISETDVQAVQYCSYSVSLIKTLSVIAKQ